MFDGSLPWEPEDTDGSASAASAWPLAALLLILLAVWLLAGVLYPDAVAAPGPRF
jgi:hypothetical protein